MRRTIVVLAALGLMLALGTSQALAARAKGPNSTSVQLLAINDLHGHLQPTTPGTIQVGCCNPVLTNGVQTGWAPQDRARRRHRVPRDVDQDAAHGEHEHAHRRRRRHDRREPARLGAVPRRADDRVAQLDRDGRQRRRQPRVRRGRRRSCSACRTAAATPSTAVRTATSFAGASFQYLAANVFYMGTNETILPPYEIETIDGKKIAFIGLTLEGTPTIVTPSAVAGLEFKPEVADRQRARAHARRARTRSRRSSCCSTRAGRRRSRRRCSRGPRTSRTRTWTSTSA